MLFLADLCAAPPFDSTVSLSAQVRPLHDGELSELVLGLQPGFTRRPS